MFRKKFEDIKNNVRWKKKGKEKEHQSSTPKPRKNTIPSAHSAPNTRQSNDKELKGPSTYPKKLLRHRSDTAIDYPQRERTLPTSTSGMQRKKFSLKSTGRQQSAYNMAKMEDLSEFQTKLDHFAKNVQKIIDAGYEPLIACDYPDIMRNTELITPVEEYKNAKEISLGRKQSVCLFEKDGVLYTTRYVDMINLYDKPPNLVPAKDGPYIFAMAAKKINDGEATNQELVLELRVIALTTSGHGTLVKNEAERLGIVCAGEFYVNDGKIILIDDKTGNFNDRMSKLQQHLTEHYGDDPQFSDYFGEDKKFNFGGLVGHVMGSAKKGLFYTYAADDLNLPKDTAIAEERLLQKLVDLHYQDPKFSKKPVEPSISTNRLSTFNLQAIATDQQQAETEKPTRKF